MAQQRIAGQFRLLLPRQQDIAEGAEARADTVSALAFGDDPLDDPPGLCQIGLNRRADRNRRAIGDSPRSITDAEPLLLLVAAPPMRSPSDGSLACIYMI
jgi:hypothetical protein